MDFLGIGLPELVVILVLTLIVVGPQRLPETAAKVGRAVREFRRYSSGVTKELMDAVQDLEREYQELRGELNSVSGELRQKAEAFGHELTSVVDDARDKLTIEEAKPQGTLEAAPAGDNGSAPDAAVTATSAAPDASVTPTLPAIVEEAAEQ